MPAGYTTIRLDAGFVTTQANRTGEMSEIIDIRTPAGKRFDYPADRGLELFLMTHESFTTDSTGGNQETFSLSNELADSPALNGDGGADGEDTSPPSSGQADLVLYDSGTQVAPDAVRYNSHSSNPNEFDYTNPDASADTLDVYYVWEDSSQIEGRYYKANEEEHDQVFGTTGGEMHTARVYHQEDKVTFMNSFSAGPKERLKFFVNTQVDLTNWNSNTGDQAEPTSGAASFSHIRIPVTQRAAADRRSIRSRR